jgi:hypothetical protein
MERQQADQMEAMEAIFGPIRQWLSGQGMSSLMGGRNPFSQDPNPQMERAYLDHVNTLRGLQGGYNQAYGNLGGMGMDLMNQAGAGGNRPDAPGLMNMPNAPDLSYRLADMAMPQAQEAFNPHLNTAAMQALAGQGQQARNAITETSPMRGGQMASALNQASNQEAMSKAALTYQAGQEARNNALKTAVGMVAPQIDIFNTQSGNEIAQGAQNQQAFGTMANMYGMDRQANNQLALASMPWIEQGQLGPLNQTRDLSQDIMGLISGLYGGAEESGINRALGLLGGSSFPNAGAIMGQGSQLAALEAQRRATNASAKGSKKGSIGSGIGSLIGMYFGGPMGAALGGKAGGSLMGSGTASGPSSGQGGANPIGGWRRY